MDIALLEGVGMGLVLSLIIGPVFFALVQNSMEYGFRNSLFMALGILASDSVYVIVSYFGVGILANNSALKAGLGYVGGMIMIGFGIANFLKKNVQRPNSGGLVANEKPKRRKGFLKGLSLNGVNPFVLLFWISIAGMVQLKKKYQGAEVFFFYGGMLLTVFGTDLVKAYVAKKLSKFITPRFMGYLNKIVGIVLVIFGIRLIWFAMNKAW